MPNGDLLKPEQFKATKGGYEFQIDPNGGRSSKNAFEVFTESRCTKFPKADAICFRPDVTPGAIIEKEGRRYVNRSEEHTSELQSLMRISYAVFCLKKKTNIKSTT